MNNSTLTIKDWTDLELEDLKDLTVLYCRLSQDDGNIGDSNSIVNQKLLLADFAKKEKFNNLVYFIDDGFSGVSFNRPAIQKALELVESGKVRNFIVKDLSRLARNYLFSGQLIELTFPENDVRFIAINDGVDSRHQTDSDANLLPLRNLFNEWYARDTSKKIRAVIQAKARSGKRIGTNVIYGYKRNPENPQEWIIDPVGAKIVQRIFNEVKTGKSLSQIAKDLKRDKIETPSRRRLSLGENPTAVSFEPYNWHRAVIEKIINKTEYLGHTVNLRTTVKSFKDKRKIDLPKDQWLIFEKTHEAIIDQETFDIVQKMRQHKRVMGSPRFEKGHENIFAGLVFCGTCGSKHYFCAHQKNGTNLDHYKCSKHSKTVDRCSNPHYIRKVNLEEIVLAELNTLIEAVHLDEEGFIQSLSERFKLKQTKQLNRQKQELVSLQKRFDEIDNLIQRLYEDNVVGKLSDERFQKMSQSYEVEQSELSLKISQLTTELSEEEKNCVNITQLLSRVKQFQKLETLSVEIVNSLIDKIIIHKPAGNKRNRIMNIEIHYNFIGSLNEKSE